MKKLTIVFILLLGIACFCACSNTGEVHLSTTTDTQAIVENTSETVSETIADGDVTTKDTTETITKKQNPPEYVPGSIKLLDNDYYGYGVYRPYRLCYYQIPGEILSLAQRTEGDTWREDTFGETIIEIDKMNKMLLMEYVKHYNIPKEDFDVAVEKMMNWPDANENEESEVPNSDIIYSFDYKIINNYYRYE